MSIADNRKDVRLCVVTRDLALKELAAARTSTDIGKWQACQMHQEAEQPQRRLFLIKSCLLYAATAMRDLVGKDNVRQTDAA